MRIGIGIGIGTMRQVGGGGGPAPVAFLGQSINADGWSGTYATPPTFTPDSSPESFTVTRQGYDTLGTVASITENMICTRRTQQVWPNQDSLSTDQISVSSYLYSTDTVLGATNNSAETSPKPVANWGMFDRTVVGNTLDVELFAFHRNARLGEQIAAVEFRVSDGTTTITQVVSASVVSSRYASIGQKAVVYRAQIDVSSLINPSTLTLNAKVFPWIGAAASVLDSADQTLAREFSPRTFRRDTALLAAPRVAYVRTAGNDATGVVSTTPATASANPYLTVLAAINGHHTAGGLDGAIIYIGDDGGTAFVLGSTAGTRTQTAAELIITREAGVPRANARVSFGVAGFRPRFGASGGWIRFTDVGITRTGIFNFTGEVASPLSVVFDGVDWVGNSHDAATINVSATIWFGGVSAASLGASTFSSATNQAIRCIRNCVLPTPETVEGFNLVANTITGMTGAVSYAASSSSGTICAFNVMQGMSSSIGAITIKAVSVGVAIVQNVFEYTSETSGPSVRISADNATNNTTHVIMHSNTQVGFYNNGRGNLFYDDGATPRTHNLMSCVGNIHVSINTKGDVFAADGARIGNRAYQYGVDCRGEFSQFIDADNMGLGGKFAQVYPGLRANIGTSLSVRNDYLPTNHQGTTSGPTAGAGGGNYALLSGSAAADRAAAVLKFDIAGNARNATLTASGAYRGFAEAA